MEVKEVASKAGGEGLLEDKTEESHSIEAVEATAWLVATSVVDLLSLLPYVLFLRPKVSRAAGLSCRLVAALVIELASK